MCAAPVRTFVCLGILLLSQCCALALAEPASHPFEIRYLPPAISTDRKQYEFDVIKAALEATVETHGPYTLSAWKGDEMNLLRGVRELARGEIVNVATNPLSNEWVREDIDIIPIPLMKGLLGYRAMVVRKQDLKRLARIRKLSSLRKLSLGQLDYWSDIAVYEANDFEVVKGGSMEVLFSMLERERFDYIALGVGEVDKIFASLEEDFPDLSILPSSYLYYPFPVYTYVCACEPEIKERLQAGIKTIKNNGTLNELFSKRFDDALKRIQAQGSHIFRIENTFIPDKLLPQSTL